jgi:hypothetical protein
MSKDKETVYVEDGLVGLAREAERLGITDEDWANATVTVHDGDSFVARRGRMEIARRNKERTPKK